MNRRNFIKTVPSAVFLAEVHSFPRAQPAPLAPSATAVRKDVSKMLPNATDLVQYRLAVGLLKNLPSSDPRNWAQLAGVHNSHCPHNNWWFLPWHRAYLAYFEQTCREILGAPNFKVPYWDWTRNPRIPAPFWEGDLMDTTRQVGPNEQISSEFVGLPVISKIMDSTSVSTLFSGSTSGDQQRQEVIAGGLENGPHNGVHSTIRGNMGGWLSPLDPVFWLHHANVDRLWASSQRAAAKRFPGEPLWGNHMLEAFYDPTAKKQVKVKTIDTMNAADWGAVYDAYESKTKATGASLGVALGTAEAQNLLAAQRVGRVLSTAASAEFSTVSFSTPASVSLRTTPELTSAFSAVLSSNGPAAAEANLVIEGVSRPKQQTTALRVFLNCKNPSSNTPIDDPSYVGTVSFFAAHQPEHGDNHSSSFVLDLGNTLEKLAAVGQYDPKAPLDVALVAVDALNPGKPSGTEVIKPTRVKLVVIS